jgi:hypothetical protein
MKITIYNHHIFIVQATRPATNSIKITAVKYGCSKISQLILLPKHWKLDTFRLLGKLLAIMKQSILSND